MSPKAHSADPHQAKSPPAGQPFSRLELASLAAKALGLLIIASAALGFGFMLIRATASYPAVVEGGQATSEVFFSVLGTYLGTFAGLGLLGGLIFGAGVWLERRSARPAQAAKKAKK